MKGTRSAFIYSDIRQIVGYRTPVFMQPFPWRLHITITYNLLLLRLWYADVVTVLAQTPEVVCRTVQTSRHDKDGTWSQLTWFETTVLLPNCVSCLWDLLLINNISINKQMLLSVKNRLFFWVAAAFFKSSDFYSRLDLYIYKHLLVWAVRLCRVKLFRIPVFLIKMTLEYINGFCWYGFSRQTIPLVNDT